jgi:hypothetical protein
LDTSVFRVQKNVDDGQKPLCGADSHHGTLFASLRLRTRKEATMKTRNVRRVTTRARVVEKSSKAEQIAVLILGAIALLGFLLT